MLQCTALRKLPVPETLLRIAAAGDDLPEDPVWFAGGYAACELGEGHEGEHADHLWNSSEPEAAVWLRWSDAGYRFVTLHWCVFATADGEGCELFAGHPPQHSWDVTDPTYEALAADVAAHPERWGLPPRHF